MNRLIAEFGLAKTLSAIFLLLALPAATWAQVPVDENGEIIGQVETQDADTATGNEDIPLLSTVDLEELVGPIALYPDDLLAIVLPATAYPLQVVEVARFLEALEDDPSLEPNPEWDDSVVALTNYPEVVELLNDDIDWTWRLGEAVVSQQADVVAAIETFRDRAYAAGNLKSDSYQTVSRDEGVIEITPVAEDVIYVPYYEPERVVVYQPRPVYYYYPRPYPVYYYPYSSSHAFNRGYFWGVTTAFTIGWYSDSLNVFHHSYHGHPYYGHSYWDRWWYRRPTINIYSNNYVGRNTTVTVNHYNRGDRWRPRHDRRDFVSDRRITRNRHNSGGRTVNQTNRVPGVGDSARRTTRSSVPRRPQNREPIAFRERPRTPTIARSDSSARTIGQADRREDRAEGATRRAPVTRTTPRNSSPRRTQNREPIAFRDRPRTPTIARSDSAPRTTRQADRREDRTEGATTREPVTRTTRRGSANAARTRSEPTPTRRSQPQQQTQEPQMRRLEPKERRSDRTPKLRPVQTTAQLRRAEPARPIRRSEPVRQAQRAEPTRQARRASPAPQVRRAEPTRKAAAAPRPQKAQRKSAAAAESRPSRDRKSQRRR